MEDGGTLTFYKDTVEYFWYINKEGNKVVESKFEDKAETEIGLKKYLEK